MRDPIAQVLCIGSTDSGGEAMAVSFRAPTCWSPQGWAVYRFTGAKWRFVMVQRGAFLAGPGCRRRKASPKDF